MVERVRATETKPSTKEGGNYFAAPKTKMKFVRSGSKLLDLALGGGWAVGRVSNIIGDKSTGKTLLCIEAAANFAQQFKSAPIFYREAEAAFDEPYAEALGMPVKRVDFGKDPLETVEDLYEDLTACLKASKKGPSLYILDSLDALSDDAEMKRDLDEGSYGTGKAKKLSEIFRREVRNMEDANMTLIIVSQVRDNIGATMPGVPKVKRSGGRALDFYASQVVMLSNIGTNSQQIHGIKRATGIEVRAKVTKNKVGLPLREAQFTIQFGFGVDDMAACISWLAQGNYLKDVDKSLTKENQNKWIKSLAALDDDAYWGIVDNVHDVVQDRWYEIETEFLPTRRKYT